MRAKPEAFEWYFFKAGSHAGEKTGPFSWERLRQQAGKGVLEPTDVVWDPGTGWRMAAEIPGLFPTAASPGVAGSYPDAQPLGPSVSSRSHSWLSWFLPLIALVIVGGGLGIYFGLIHDSGGATPSDQATTTSAAATTTIPGATTQSTTTEQSTPTTVSATGTVGETPDIYLDKGDFGDVVVLSVGDRVRVDLEPWVGDEVQSVRWNFKPVSVRETDSGTEMVSGVVAACWLELEAVVAGPVTVRAEYVFPNGTSSSKWVVYLRVRD